MQWWPIRVPTCGFLMVFNTLRPRQNGRHFPDDIFNCIFLNGNVWISLKIPLKLVPKGPINNIPALVQIMAWRRSGDKPLSEPMMVSLLTHICVTRPQWVNLWYAECSFWIYDNILTFTNISWHCDGAMDILLCERQGSRMDVDALVMQGRQAISICNIDLVILEYYGFSTKSTLKIKKAGFHFVDDLFIMDFLKKRNCCILMQISLSFVQKDPVDNMSPLILAPDRQPDITWTSDHPLVADTYRSYRTPVCKFIVTWVKFRSIGLLYFCITKVSFIDLNMTAWHWHCSY